MFYFYDEQNSNSKRTKDKNSKEDVDKSFKTSK